MSTRLTAAYPVLPCEDPSDFPRLHQALIDHYQPANPIDSILVQQLAIAVTRLARAEALAAGHFANTLNQLAGPEANSFPALAASLDSRFALLLRYQRAANSDFRHLLASLQRAKKSDPLGAEPGGEPLSSPSPSSVPKTASAAAAPTAPPASPTPSTPPPAAPLEPLPIKPCSAPPPPALSPPPRPAASRPAGARRSVI